MRGDSSSAATQSRATPLLRRWPHPPPCCHLRGSGNTSRSQRLKKLLRSDGTRCYLGLACLLAAGPGPSFYPVGPRKLKGRQAANVYVQPRLVFNNR